MKVTGIAMVLMISMIAIWTGVESVSVEIPPDAVKWGLGKVDSAFSCSKYDGFAACWNNDQTKRDRECNDSSCGRKDTWQYKWWLGGQCYCCKC